MKRSIIFGLAGFGLASMLFALVAFVGEATSNITAQSEDYAIVYVESGFSKADVYITTANGTGIIKTTNAELQKVTHDEMIRLNQKGYRLLTSTQAINPGSKQYFQYIFEKPKQ